MFTPVAETFAAVGEHAERMDAAGPLRAPGPLCVAATSTELRFGPHNGPEEAGVMGRESKQGTTSCVLVRVLAAVAAVASAAPLGVEAEADLPNQGAQAPAEGRSGSVSRQELLDGCCW
jgi:hypothetical protein